MMTDGYVIIKSSNKCLKYLESIPENQLPELSCE
jgi:hypothetical protein